MPVARKLTKKRRITKTVVPKNTLKRNVRRIQNGAGFFSFFVKDNTKRAIYIANRVSPSLQLQNFDKETQYKFKKGLILIIKSQFETHKYKNINISLNVESGKTQTTFQYKKKIKEIFEHLPMKSTHNGGYEPKIDPKIVKKDEKPLMNYIDKFVEIITMFFQNLLNTQKIESRHMAEANTSSINPPTYFVPQGARVGKVYFYDIGSYEAVDPVLLQLNNPELGGASTSDKSERKYRHNVVNTFITLYGSYAKALSNFINYRYSKSQGTLTNHNQFQRMW